MTRPRGRSASQSSTKSGADHRYRGGGCPAGRAIRPAIRQPLGTWGLSNSANVLVRALADRQAGTRNRRIRNAVHRPRNPDQTEFSSERSAFDRRHRRGIDDGHRHFLDGGGEFPAKPLRPKQDNAPVRTPRSGRPVQDPDHVECPVDRVGEFSTFLIARRNVPFGGLGSLERNSNSGGLLFCPEVHAIPVNGAGDSERTKLGRCLKLHQLRGMAVPLGYGGRCRASQVQREPDSVVEATA